MGISNNIPADIVPVLASKPDGSNVNASRAGVLIINADDWGRNIETTDRILECVRHGSVSSTSAMVFMNDSERAAALARELGIDAGLHLNFTTGFSARAMTGRLAAHHERVANFLLRNRLSQTVYHPGLVNSFEYLVATQLEEFSRIYCEEPRRIDGHHHMHLCANVIFSGLLPFGTIARRNFSSQPEEKKGVKRLYRRVVDHVLSKRHRLTDFFFSLSPLEPVERLNHIFAVASRSVVELETHPVNAEEYRFLTGDEIHCWTAESSIASCFMLPHGEVQFGQMNP